MTFESLDSRKKEEKIPRIEKITVEDLEPVIPEENETVLVLQRNAKDNRDLDSSLEMGALLPEAAEEVKKQVKLFFDDIFQSLGKDDKDSLDVFVVAADTKLDTPLPGIKGEHKRAFETAEQVIIGIQESMEFFGINEKQLLNKRKKPVEVSERLRDLKMFEDSPDFVEFIKGKYGTEKDFWIAYEDDVEAEVRKKMGAEGPDDIAIRIENYLRTIATAMKFYHKANPGRRVVVWIDSHYDTISPYAKRRIAKMERETYLPVENGAGIVIKVDKEQNATTRIQGQDYQFSLGVIKETGLTDDK